MTTAGSGSDCGAVAPLAVASAHAALVPHLALPPLAAGLPAAEVLKAVPSYFQFRCAAPAAAVSVGGAVTLLLLLF